jgi:hypothetical protein
LFVDIQNFLLFRHQANYFAVQLGWDIIPVNKAFCPNTENHSEYKNSSFFLLRIINNFNSLFFIWNLPNFSNQINVILFWGIFDIPWILGGVASISYISPSKVPVKITSVPVNISDTRINLYGQYFKIRSFRTHLYNMDIEGISINPLLSYVYKWYIKQLVRIRNLSKSYSEDTNRKLALTITKI